VQVVIHLPLWFGPGLSVAGQSKAVNHITRPYLLSKRTIFPPSTSCSCSFGSSEPALEDLQTASTSGSSDAKVILSGPNSLIALNKTTQFSKLGYYRTFETV
jgi:hypothetical protein